MEKTLVSEPEGHDKKDCFMLAGDEGGKEKAYSLLC